MDDGELDRELQAAIAFSLDVNLIFFSNLYFGKGTGHKGRKRFKFGVFNRGWIQL